MASMFGRGRRRLKRSTSSGSMVWVRSIQIVTGVLLVLLAIPPFLDFPRLGFWLIPLGAIYLFALARWPMLWLLALPVFTVAIDLATYTGRFIYNEFDWFFLLTLSSTLIFGRCDLSIFRPRLALVLPLLYLGILFAGYGAWSVFLNPPQELNSNPYYSPLYGYKVIKGVLWAFLLLPGWSYLGKKNAGQATSWLLAGCCIASVLLGFIILWERGTLGIIFAGAAWYSTVNSLLDLTSSYRVTGLFSDMHTGGEALDGVMILLLPATVHALFSWRRPLYRAVAGAAAMSLAYCALVGFTRTTYASFGLAIVLYAAIALWRRRGLPTAGHRPLAGLILLAIGAAMAAAIFAFSYAGRYGLACFGALQLLAYLYSKFSKLNQQTVAYLMLVIAVLLVAFAIDAHYTSRWVEQSHYRAAVVGLGLSASFIATVLAVNQLAFLKEFDRLVALIALVALCGVSALGLGNYMMGSRMAMVGKDMQSRMTHWRRVTGSAEDSFSARAVGNGVGTFPINYVYHYPDTVSEVGSFSIAKNSEGRNVLSIGGGHDLEFAQRVQLLNKKEIQFEMAARSDQKAGGRVKLCHRNLLFPSNFGPPCSKHKFRLEEGVEGYQIIRVSISPDEWRLRRRANWPLTLQVSNLKQGAVIEIASIQLHQGGAPLLSNTSFDAGTDYWFFYHDYAHLPWHIKNTWVQFWYDTGWLGLLAVVGMLLTAIRTEWRQKVKSPYGIFMVTGLLAFSALGLFGSPLDSARASWLFFFFLFTTSLTEREAL